MNFYIQKTGRKYRPELKHPIGKYVLSFMWHGKDRTEFLLAPIKDNGWVTSGFPTLGRTYIDRIDGLEQKNPDNNPWYFNDKKEAINILNTMSLDWKQAYSVYKVTTKGFRLVKSGLKEWEKQIDNAKK